jgi:MGT family glycosyltransferase
LASFVFTTWEGGGHVTPALIVAAALQARGHRIRFVSDACNASDAEAFGLPFESWRTAPNRPDKRPETDPLKDYEAGSPAELIARLCDRVMCGPASAYAADVQAILAETPGATVVSQELLFGAMIGAEAAHASLALLTANLWPFPTLEGVPPFGAGFAPADDEFGRQRDAMVRMATEALYDQHLPQLNAARETAGLKPLTNLLQQPHRAQRVLLGVSRAFDFAPASLPAQFRYVGPQLADPAWVEPWVSPWPADDRRPLVLIAFSTFFQGQTETVRRAVEGAATLPVRVLALLGPGLPPGSVAANDNVQVVASAPFSQVLPLASAVVTHAGHASAVRPLLESVPLICLPMGRDQPDNAARVAARGAGLVLSADASAQAIGEALRRVLEEPSFREAAGRLGAAIAAEQDAGLAVAELEALAAERPTGSSR